MYRALTRDIEVTVEPYYLEEQSDPDDGRYVWGYRIVISNHSDASVRLMTRYWHITDENGQVDEVSGPGVIGEQPLKHRDSLRVHTHRYEFEIPELADADRTHLSPKHRLSS